MNVGIVVLKNGTPCLVYDEPLSAPIACVEFNRKDFLVTLVYEEMDETGAPKKKKNKNEPVLKGSRIARMMKPLRRGAKLEYPLDHNFVELLEKNKEIAVARIDKGAFSEVKLVPVVFAGR
jgi:hypothetical protein